MKRKYSQEEIQQRMMGRIYWIKDDLNIFVRKKGLYACTMNLGNVWRWVIIGALALMGISIILLLL